MFLCTSHMGPKAEDMPNVWVRNLILSAFHIGPWPWSWSDLLCASILLQIAWLCHCHCLTHFSCWLPKGLTHLLMLIGIWINIIIWIGIRIIFRISFHVLFQIKVHQGHETGLKLSNQKSYSDQFLTDLIFSKFPSGSNWSSYKIMQLTSVWSCVLWDIP